jgi:hypothetical protein
MNMDKQNSDQGWQQIQTNIESFFSQTLANDLQRVEYKPRFIALLTMSSDHHQNDLQETDILRKSAYR